MVVQQEIILYVSINFIIISYFFPHFKRNVRKSIKFF